MKRKILPILSLLCLPLLMSNSPAPYRGPNEYEDYSIDSFKVEKMNTGEYIDYSYTFDLNNTGQGYISLNSYYLLDKSSGAIIDSPSYYSCNELIGPSQKRSFHFVLKQQYQENDIDFMYFGYNSNFNPKAANMHDFVIESKNELDNGYKVYNFKCDYEVLTEHYGVYHNPILKVSDKASTHFFYGETIKNKYSFYTEADLDVSSLTIEAVNFVEAYDYYYNHNNGNSKGVSQTVFFVFVIIGLSLTGAGIIVASVLLLRHIKKK